MARIVASAPGGCLDHLGLVIRGALDGVGLAFMAEEEITAELADGRLIRLLRDWYQPFPGFFLYYLSRRQRTAALSALVNVVRL